MPDLAKDPGVILHEAILICGDCPECGSDNWTHDEEHGSCQSCGARFSPTIPLQMLKSREALTTLLAERDRYRDALMQIWTNSTLNPHQSNIVRDALGL